MGARASLDLAASSLAVMSSLSSEISDQFEFIRVTDLDEVAETNETFICSLCQRLGDRSRNCRYHLISLLRLKLESR